MPAPGNSNPQDITSLGLIRYTAEQLASSLLRQIAMSTNQSSEAMNRWRMDVSKAHFHDKSTTEIAWNDVQAIQMYNAISGEGIPVPDMASESANLHYHTSDYDGGLVIGAGPHDHRDLVTGCGFAFAVYHPGTALPQQPWAI